jgi:site-specific DNA-methyltransferase (adenine-specific)/modification methylase
MLKVRKEEIADGVILYLGDNAVILPAVHGERAIVTDPPYGQKQNTNVAHAGGIRAVTPGCGSRAVANVQRARATGALHSAGQAIAWPDGIVGDDEPFDPDPWLSVSPRSLFWGAHKFAERLPAGSWLVWDKVPTGKVRDQGDGEAAWMSGASRPMRIYRLLWDGVCVGSAARDEVTAGQQRVHPTQKPVVLMKWCIGQMQLPRKTIIVDPYMGSGSTGVAAIQLGFPFVGMEIVPQYFDTACRRISEALKQGDMFVDKPARSGA